ncbi:hypothetical protein PAMP_005931 [Pampus punctatissimus]
MKQNSFISRSPQLSSSWWQCESNGNKSETEVHESPLVDRESSPVVPPLHPSKLIPHPHFSISPSCEFLHSAQDAQSINKTLSPPLGARAQEATQEPVAFPLKLLHWWPPGMPIALGTGRTWSYGVEEGDG